MDHLHFNILHLLGFNANGGIEIDESDDESDGGEMNDADNGIEPNGMALDLKVRRLQLRINFNPFNLPDTYFRKHYRISLEVATKLLNLIRPEFDIAQRASHIPVHLEFCIGLRMYASGGYQLTTGQDNYFTVSQSVVGRIMDRFTDSLVNLADQFIQFHKTREERQDIQTGFLRYTRIPGILGLIDGTVIKFLRPTENEEAFFNWEHKHSINVQIVSDDNFLIRNVRICPGSNTDQHIWNHSHAKEYMESLRSNLEILTNEGSYYLIGDNGYSASPIMLTPIRNAVPGSPQAVFTREICLTRSRQERLNACLVNKWRILKRERAMRYLPIKVGRIIIGACVLHNCIILDGNINNQGDENQIQQDMIIDFNHAAGEIERDYIIQHYFAV